MLPFGFFIAIGLVVMRLLMTGVSIVLKFAVLPVSAMSGFGMFCVGGPKSCTISCEDVTSIHVGLVDVRAILLSCLDVIV